MAFKDQRRQKFLGEADYLDYMETYDLGINSAKERLTEKDKTLTPAAISRFRWRIASESLEVLLLNYTAGHSVAELREQFPAVIATFDEFIPTENPPSFEAHTLDINQQEAYVYVLWLLALCKLLGHDALIPTVMGWINKRAETNRGRDGLFESIVEKLTGAREPSERWLFHANTYRPLARAAAAENPEDRPALVKEFVENWYKNMKPCYWYGTHTDKAGYFGYWCLEAALVTYLWNIDDSSYRDHLVYPKDLIDFSRALDRSTPPTPDAPVKLRGLPNETVPKTGWWYSPALGDKGRQHFNEGDKFPGPKTTNWGLVIWGFESE